MYTRIQRSIWIAFLPGIVSLILLKPISLEFPNFLPIELSLNQGLSSLDAHALQLGCLFSTHTPEILHRELSHDFGSQAPVGGINDPSMLFGPLISHLGQGLGRSDADAAGNACPLVDGVSDVLGEFQAI